MPLGQGIGAVIGDDDAVARQINRRLDQLGKREFPGAIFFEGQCEACRRAGIVFVGPPAAAIRAMGLKDRAKLLMEKAGVPIVPGYHGERQDAKFLREKAYEIGYPVLFKPAAGGGGRGMRRVD